MMSFKEFLQESINDKGILKAIFVVGLPGSGKSYTINQIKGEISPRIINTDKALEHLSKKTGIPANSDTWKTVFGDKSKKMTREMLFHYVNGMLPLFVDGTSNNTSNILRRVGFLESIGYDVGMIFVNVDIELAKKRAKERALKINRTVDESFIDEIYQESEQNKKFFKSKFDYFKEYESTDELDNELLMKLFNSVQDFFKQDVENPVGKRNIEKMRKNSDKYLTDSVFEKAYLDKEIDSWYKK